MVSPPPAHRQEIACSEVHDTKVPRAALRRRATVARENSLPALLYRSRTKLLARKERKVVALRVESVGQSPIARQPNGNPELPVISDKF